MKTYYFKQLKSGNFEIATESDFTHKTDNLKEFYYFVTSRKSTTFDRRTMRMKQAGIIKARYSQSQTYFQSAVELEKYLNR